MKNTKRIISILLLVVLLVGLTGCGSKGDDSANSFERGVWTENTYENTFADITFHAPEDWYIASDEEIATRMNLGFDDVYGDQSALSKKIIEMKCVYDAYAVNQLVGTNVIFSYENLSMSIGGTSYDADDYLDVTEKQLKEMTSPVYTVGERSDITVAGQEYRMGVAEVTDYGMSQAYLIRRVEDYMVCIIITTVGVDSLDDILSCFE